MEELLELTKKQLRIQKIITGFLAIIIVILLVAGGILVNQVKQMSVAVEEVTQKVEAIDVNTINEIMSDTQSLIVELEQYVTRMNDMAEQMETFDNWLSDAFGTR